MGLDAFRNNSDSNGSNNTSSCNKDDSKSNQSTKNGKYDESYVLKIMSKCNSETEGEKISRSDYEDWKETTIFDCPSTSWFYRNGGWNNWLTKAGIKHNNKGTKIKFDGITEMSPAKAYVIGVLMGDGTVNTNKGQHKVQLQAVDKPFIDMFCDRLCQFTGLNKESITEGKADGRYYATKTSKELALEMDKYMSETWIKWVDELAEDELLYLVSGLYDSEGHYKKDVNICTFSTTSISMKNLFVWCLTEHFLNSSKINEVRRKSIDYHDFSVQEYFREDRCSIEYQIILSKEFSQEFINSVSCSINRKLGESE